MQQIDLDTLAHVTGGALSSSVSSSISALSTQITDLKYASANQNNSSSNLLLPMVLLMNNRRQQSTVVTPGATVVSG